jgi:hypothetical protein
VGIEVTQEPLWPADEDPEEETEVEPQQTGISLARLQELMAALGVDRILAKSLAVNDNSKQQVYVSPGFEGLNLLPNSGVVEAPSRGRGGVIYYAPVRLSWIDQSGEIAQVPSAKLILYPQYPEVRLSGFLAGARFSPSAIMTSREEGRVLFLGVRDADGEVFAYADTATSLLAAELRAQPAGPMIGVFRLLAPTPATPVVDWRARLLGELRDLAARGWVPGSFRESPIAIRPCNDPRCGGYTLESELGIVANANPGPDYHGVWELKAHSDSVVTIMDKSPGLGFFRTAGFIAFMDKYGYQPIANPEPYRLNFGGIYRTGDAPLRDLHLEVIGYDPATGTVDLSSGRVALVHTSGEEALAYPFLALMNHWRKKHNNTAYVDYKARGPVEREFRYGPTAVLCEDTDPLRVIDAISRGKVYLDHSPWLKRPPGSRPERKHRYMIRVKMGDLDALYDRAVRESLV